MSGLCIFGDSHFVMSPSFYFLQELKSKYSEFELFAVSGSMWIDWKNDDLKKHNINWQYKNESTQQTQMGQCPWAGFRDIVERIQIRKLMIFEFGSNEMLALQGMDEARRDSFLADYERQFNDWYQQSQQNQIVWILPIQIRFHLVSEKNQQAFRQMIFRIAGYVPEFLVIDSWQCIDENQQPILANHQDQVHVTRPLSNQWGHFLASEFIAKFEK